MKKITNALATLIFIITVTTSVSAQSWSLTGNGGTNPSTNYVGTSNNNDLVFRTNATEKMRITSGGNVGIGTNNPSANLAVGGKRIVFGSNALTGSYGANDFALEVHSTAGVNIGFTSDESGANGNGFTLFSNATYNNCGIMLTKGGTNSYLPFLIFNGGSERFRLNTDGSIGIGTSIVPGGYLLAVKGKLICEEVKVRLYATWPDYVFSNDYELQSLPELEKYIAENHHLPGVPTQEEVEKEGIEMGEMIRLQMQKIEEINLYLIEMNKRLELLQQENEQLKEKLKKRK